MAETAMEIIRELDENRPRLKAALFDFDGTISTLRHGWEEVMQPLMLEMISGPTKVDEDLVREVDEYIDRSTGIQTIFQMKWLAEEVKLRGRNPSAPEDPWWYKGEYNRRLMTRIEKRKLRIREGTGTPQEYLVRGSEALLAALKERGITLYLASGTDDADVREEAELLGVNHFFAKIAGAPAGSMDCSKESVLRELLHESRLQGSEIVVIGDGRVEISLAGEVHALALGVASYEDGGLKGLNPVKRQRLIQAGAHTIVGDFSGTREILKWLGLS